MHLVKTINGWKHSKGEEYNYYVFIYKGFIQCTNTPNFTWTHNRVEPRTMKLGSTRFMLAHVNALSRVELESNSDSTWVTVVSVKWVYDDP